MSGLIQLFKGKYRLMNDFIDQSIEKLNVGKEMSHTILTSI